MTELRDATTADADAIATLHLASWRIAYRGIVSDAFLNHEAPANRLANWRGRLAPERIGEIRPRMAFESPPATRSVANAGDALPGLVGFSCSGRTPDPEWGVVLDNLHVRPDLKGRGIGRVLIRDVALWAAAEHAGRPLHLWVYENNHAARAFYDRLRGEAVERITGRSPDGGTASSVRYVWRDLAPLIDAG